MNFAVSQVTPMHGFSTFAAIHATPPPADGLLRIAVNVPRLAPVSATGAWEQEMAI